MDLIKQWIRKQLSNPQIVMLAGILLCVFLTIFFLGDILAPVFAALVIAYLLDGIILRIQRRGAPRLAAVDDEVEGEEAVEGEETGEGEVVEGE